MKLGTLMLILGTGCIANEQTPVTITRGQFAVYWAELEQRWPVFFESQCVAPPSLPPMDDVFNMVTFIEVTAGEHFPTCSYRKRSNEIRIGDDKWMSGCVAHEIGHAVCDYLDIDMCYDFEHPEYQSKC